MKPSLLFAFLLTFCTYVSAQNSDTFQDHTYYLRILGSAKDSLYDQVLSQYDQYVALNPNDHKARIERCKFIQNAYYDSYEDYNPKADAAEACAQELLAAFPEEPEVRIYMTEFIYGDSAIAYLETLSSTIKENPESWRGRDWIVYKQLAENYELNEDYDLVIRYGELATDENDTLDMSLLLATAHKNLAHTNQAIEVLINNLDSTNLAWELNQKGRLLLELGAPDKAIEAFRMASKNGTGSEDLGSLAKAMIDNGLIAEAREYLLKNCNENSWNRTSPLHKLLEYDLAYGAADSAAVSYQRFVDLNFWNDPLGIYRLKLFALSPSLTWTFADTGRIFLLLAFILAVFIVPYLWILPIHYFGTIQKSKGKVFPESTFTWGLRHFWVVCSLWLLCDVTVTLMLDYPGLISLFNDGIVIEEAAPVSLLSANMMLVFCTGCAAFTIPFLSQKDVMNFLNRFRDSGREIMTGVGLAFLLRTGFAIYQLTLSHFGFPINTGSNVIATVSDSIVALNQFYSPWLGFLFVVILVPFYEEILFRGIFLSACERNMRFMLANALQSLVFALVHNDLKLIPFYFAFGMVAGFYRQKNQNLTTSTSMHMTNNLFAFLILMAKG